MPENGQYFIPSGHRYASCTCTRSDQTPARFYECTASCARRVARRQWTRREFILSTWVCISAEVSLRFTCSLTLKHFVTPAAVTSPLFSLKLQLLFIHCPPHDCSLRIHLFPQWHEIYNLMWVERSRTELAVLAWENKPDGKVSLCFPLQNIFISWGMLLLLAGSFYLSRLPCTPLAGCMSPRSQSRALSAQSFQLLNNTKQTVTYFQCREQARGKTWSGILQGSGLWEGWSDIGRWVEQWWTCLSIGLSQHLGEKRRAFVVKMPAASMACHVSSEFGPGSLPIPIRCLYPPVNVIKQAGTRILQQAPILEASLHKECSSQKQGLTHVSHHQSGQSTLLDRVPALLHSSYFSTFCLCCVYCRYAVMLHLLLRAFSSSPSLSSRQKTARRTEKTNSNRTAN